MAAPISWPNGPIDTVIFDCDGVLLGTNNILKQCQGSILDTERLYSEVNNEIIAKYSLLEDPTLRVISGEFKGHLMGRKKRVCAEMMIKEFQLDMSVQKYIELSYAMEALPGALEIVTAIKATGIPLGVATGSSGCTFAIKRTNHQKLFSCFDHIVVGDDLSVKEGKPAPDCFLEAARRLGQPNAGRCLVVEDSPNGVRAGLAAGMHVAWVPDPCLEVRKNVPELVADPRVVLFDSLINLQIVLLNH